MPPCEIVSCLSEFVPAVELPISFGSGLASQIRVFEELFFTPLNQVESESQWL